MQWTMMILHSQMAGLQLHPEQDVEEKHDDKTKNANQIESYKYNSLPSSSFWELLEPTVQIHWKETALHQKCQTPPDEFWPCRDVHHQKLPQHLNG